VFFLRDDSGNARSPAARSANSSAGEVACDGRFAIAHGEEYHTPGECGQIRKEE